MPARYALPALLIALAPCAVGQTAPPDTAAGRGGEADRTTTVLLPQDRGVFYYRAGPPGGVRIRSRNGRRVPVAARPTAPPDTVVGPSTPVLQPIVVDGVEADGERLTRRDLERLERDLIDAVDRRLARLLAAQRDQTPYVPPPSPVVVLDRDRPAPPRRDAVPPVAIEDAGTDEAPVRPIRPPAGDDVVTVAEVERALLDTGLFRTSRVNFEFGRATLIPVSESVVATVGDVLRRYPALRVQIGGHTDAVGSDAYNLRLSRERAEAVVDALASLGIDRDRLEPAGYGEGRPIASNETETGRALNRRVEFTVLNPGAAERVRRSTMSNGADPDRVREILREELERLRREDGDG